MIGIQREKLADWCNHHIDWIILAAGATILAYIEAVGNYLILAPEPNYGFWALLLGVVMLSIGMAAFICYRVLLRWQNFGR